jgi:D-alanine-D-alanine ligase
MALPNIAFVTGGYSGEAEISYKSAVTIQKNLDPELFNVYTIDITLDGWMHTTADGRKISIDKNDFSLTEEGKKILFNAVCIGIHGTPGEDGKLQGYFDMLGIPYTSCDAATSALTFNKRIHSGRGCLFGDTGGKIRLAYQRSLSKPGGSDQPAQVSGFCKAQ